MGRFNSFNSQMSGFISRDSDKADEDEENKEEDGLFAAPADFIEDEPKVQVEVELPAPEEERCDKDYYNAAFWKPAVNEDELADILADYE